MSQSIVVCLWARLLALGAVGALLISAGCEGEKPPKPAKEPGLTQEAQKPAAAKPAAKPEPAPKPKPAAKPAAKPKPKPKAKPKPPVAKPAAKPKPAPKPAPAKPVAKPKPVAPKPAPKPAAKPKPAPKPVAKAAPKPPAAEPKPVPPPKGATVLFDGKNTSAWARLDGKPFPWKVENGAMVCVPRSGSIRTRQTFGDQKLHIEFRTPHMPDAEKGSQGRGNSGVYIQGRYEIQVLDSHDIGRPIQNNDCGALYSLIAPSKNVCKPPLQWQTFDITFRAPKFDKDKKMTAKGRITVVQNGVKIIDNKDIPGTTPGGIDEDPTKPGALMLQDHGNTVAFRNVWVVPLK